MILNHLWNSKPFEYHRIFQIEYFQEILISNQTHPAATQQPVANKIQNIFFTLKVLLYRYSKIYYVAIPYFRASCSRKAIINEEK